MAQLAIFGHKTRGKEVIEILEMLGGKSYTGLAYKGEDPNRFYCINKESNFIDSPLVLKEVQVFSLEQFLEKYPYKVGDKVTHSDYESPLEIVGMKWEDDSIKYEVYTNDYGYWFSVDELQPYKEEINEENKIFNEILDILSSYLIDFMTPQGIDKCIKYIRENMDEYNKEELKEAIKIAIPKGYEFSKVNNQHVVFTKIQPKYPKTYEECHKLMVQWKEYDCNPNSELILCEAPIHDFCKLIVARNIYWKIAGEQMGLDKPWEPDWNDDKQGRYIIMVYENKLYKDISIVGTNFILVFPTEEMRDAFFENFKDLIESCKELL